MLKGCISRTTSAARSGSQCELIFAATQPAILNAVFRKDVANLEGNPDLSAAVLGLEHKREQWYGGIQGVSDQQQVTDEEQTTLAAYNIAHSLWKQLTALREVGPHKAIFYS